MADGMKGVDELYALFKKRKEIGLSEAARVLGVSSSTALKWARALEDEGLLEIDFQGRDISLKWIGTTRDQQISAESKPNISSRPHTASPTSSLQAEFEQVLQEYEKKVSAIRAKAEKLHDFENERAAIIHKHYIPMERRFEAELQLLNEQLSSKELEVSELEKRINGMPDRLDRLDKTARKLEQVESFARRNLDAAKASVKTEMKKIIEAQAAIDNYLAQINERVKEQDAKLKKIERELLRLKKVEGWMVLQQDSLESKLTEISKERANIMHKYSELKETASSGYAKKYLAELVKIKERYKEELDSAKRKEAEINLRIKNTKREIAKLSIESKLVANRFEKLSDSVRAAKGAEAKSKVVKDFANERKKFERELSSLSSDEREE